MGASFEGMEGMEGMTGSLSGVAVSASTEMIFADRVDLPFVTIDDPNGNPIAGQRIDLATFPLRNWRADWYSWLVLTEFVGLNWQNFELRPAWAMAGWNSPAAKPMVAGEIDGLVIAAQDERADALGEIVSQADGFISYFLDLLTAPNGYPNTARILTIANLVAGFCAMYYKGEYKRPRPTMLCPALMSPLPMPGHASFPSGHATQAHLMSLSMQDVLAGLPQLPTMTNDMDALAVRIARNREIAGLHYPSDSDAGTLLAGEIHNLLNSLNAYSWYKNALGAAVAEWQP